MKFTKLLLGILVLTVTASVAHANGELDSEINDLQVQIIRKKPQAPASKPAPVQKAQIPARRTSYVATPVVNQSPNTPTSNVNQPLYHRHATLVADTTPAPAFEPTEPGSGYYNQGPRRPRQLRPYPQQQPQQVQQIKIIRKIELMPALAISSFDGPGSSNLMPSGTSSPYSLSPSGFLLADVDFGFHNIVAETGFMMAQLGSGTGYGFTGSNQFITSEKVTTSYLGIPVNAKWMLTGEGNNSFFVKGGAIPAFMMSHNYSSSGVNSEARFGGYNLFDLLFDVGVGYDFKVWGDFHAIVDVSGFQGIFPVLTNYSVYNFGLMAGIGLGYVF